MIDLTRLLPRLLRANGSNPELAVKLAWSRAAGPGLRRNAIPRGIVGGILTIAVADAIWQKQLQQMSRELIFRVNNLLGESVVKSLVFQIDPRMVSQAQETSKQRTAKKSHGAKASTELLFAAGTIADEDLRARFIRAAENCMARRAAQVEKRSPDIAE